MSIELDIFSNLNEIDVWLKDLKAQTIPTVVRRTLLRTRPTLQRESIKRIKQFRKTATTHIKKQMFIKKRLDSNDISKMEVSLNVKKGGIRALHFMKGAKIIQKRRGINPSKKRVIKVEIFPGRITKLKAAWISKPFGHLIILKRKRGEKQKSAYPTRINSRIPIYSLFNSNFFMRPIEKPVSEKMKKEFQSQINFALMKNKPK
jgi:hypothetical protein